MLGIASKNAILFSEPIHQKGVNWLKLSMPNLKFRCSWRFTSFENTTYSLAFRYILCVLTLECCLGHFCIFLLQILQQYIVRLCQVLKCVATLSLFLSFKLLSQRDLLFGSNIWYQLFNVKMYSKIHHRQLHTHTHRDLTLTTQSLLCLAVLICPYKLPDLTMKK